MKFHKIISVILMTLTLALSGCELMDDSHRHTFSSEWSSNGEYHWHAATCGHDVVSDKAVHSFGGWEETIKPTESRPGRKVRKCLVCQYEEDEILPAIEHQHTFSSDWTSNSNYHWHEATCGHDATTEKQPHTFGEWVVDQAATTEAEGLKHRNCSVCNYRVEEVIPREVEELPELIKGKTLADLFADTSGNDKKLYEITGIVFDWKSPYTNGTAYGNFLIKQNSSDTKYYTIWGCTATTSALTYDESTESYVFNNPRDFLTNDITKNIEIGDTVTMWLSRCDNESYVEAHGLVISVQKKNPLPDSGTLTVDIYATNDIHGQIESDGNRMSIAYLGSYMKNKSKDDNTLLLDQGDSWQGSIYSNHNRGALVNDVMTAAHYDARTVGNHDFDWGVEPLIANTARAYNGYTIPVLAANVYDYNFSTKTEGTNFQSDIGQKTVTYTLENGLKVGIVGIIGQDQITSITSSYVQNICFKNHIPVIKEEATKLRNEGCDIVILSAHTGQEDLAGNGLDNYVDLALCGHTHRFETDNEGDLYYAQFGAYNERIGHITLTYDLSTRSVSSTTINAISKSQVENSVIAPDSEISSIVNSYNDECREEAEVLLANNVDSFSQSAEAANLMCKAMMDRCITEGYNNVVLAYCNTARKALPYGMWKYSDIYTSFPFDNIVYIVTVKGSDILNEVRSYNNVCYNSTFNCQVDPNGNYQIACLDYLLFHTNNSRYYNYFYSFNGTTDGQLSVNYRLILREWLISNGYNSGKALSSSNYSSYNDSFNRSRLTEI